MVTQSHHFWLILALLIPGCESSHKNERIDPRAPVQPQDSDPGNKRVDVFIGDWQSQLRDSALGGNVSYSMDADGRLRISLLVYARGQGKILAERQEWKGVLGRPYEGTLVRSSCGNTNTKVSLGLAVREADVLTVNDAFPLDRVQGGLSEDVHTATELQGLPVEEGCFVDGKVDQFKPASLPSSPGIVSPSSLRAPDGFIREACLETLGQTLNSHPLVYTMRALLDSQNMSVQSYQAEDCEKLEQKLHGARYLELWGDRLDDTHQLDARILARLPQLEKLMIMRHRVVQAQALSALTALKQVNFIHVTFDDVTFVKQLPQLKELFYNNVPFQQLAVASNATVETVTVLNGNLETLGGDADFPALKRLHLGSPSLKNVDGINRFKKLEQLSLKETALTDISPLQELMMVDVELPSAFTLENCPVFLGSCAIGNRKVYGSTFGSKLPGSRSFALGKETLPGLGKILQK